MSIPSQNLLEAPPFSSARPTQTADRYGLMVAEVYAGGQNINLKMISEGHAVVYTQFLRSCPETQVLLLYAEAEAQHQRLNLWN